MDWEKKLRSFAAFTAPKIIKIDDFRLGVTNRVLQLGILIAVLVSLITNPPLYEEVPSGFASFFGGSGKLLECVGVPPRRLHRHVAWDRT